MRAARKPPDADHPYGHRKFETLAAAGIFVFLLLAVLEVGAVRAGAPAPAASPRGHAAQLRRDAGDAGGQHRASCATRRREAGGYNSELLLADADPYAQRRADVDARVLVSLAGVWLGLPAARSDRRPGHRRVHRAHRLSRSRATTSGILSDRVVIDEDDIRRVVMGVPGVSAAITSARAGRWITSSSTCTCGSRRDAADRGAPPVARGQGSADGRDTRRSPTRSSTSNRRRRNAEC